MRRLAKNDPAWQSYPADQRVLLAAQQAAQDIADEAARKVANAQRQALKTAEVEQAVAKSWAKEAAAITPWSSTSTKRRATPRASSAMRFAAWSIPSRQPRARRVLASGAKALMLLFDAQNPLMSRDLAMEVFGNGSGTTGNKLAQDGAKAWLKTIEQLRQRFNAAGGDAGKLDYGYLPQPHDQARVLQAGADKWSTEMLPAGSLALRERGRQPHERCPGAGRVARIVGNDQQRRPQQEHAGWIQGGPARVQTVAAILASCTSRTAGLPRLPEPVRHGQHVRRHDAAHQRLDARHRAGRALRPNPEAQMRLQVDLASRADGGPKRVFGNTPESYWRVMSGASSHAESPVIARVASDIRNIESFGKLRGALLSSLTDLPTYFVTAGFNKLGYWEALKNLGKVATEGDTREFLTMHGVIAESMISDLNRWSGDNIKTTGRAGCRTAPCGCRCSMPGRTRYAVASA